MTAPAASFMTSAPLNFKAHIPKQKRRHSKSTRKSAPPSDGDDDSKPSSTAERKKLEKKSTKKSSKKASKRHSKKSKKYSSSTSASESDSDDSSPAEQVGSQPFIYLPITTTLTTYILLPWWWKVSLQSNCKTRRLWKASSLSRWVWQSFSQQIFPKISTAKAQVVWADGESTVNSKL